LICLKPTLDSAQVGLTQADELEAQGILLRVCFLPSDAEHFSGKGFHRIRHHSLLASDNRAANIARALELLAVPDRPKQPDTSAQRSANRASFRVRAPAAADA
jgi:hypothetical protein